MIHEKEMDGDEVIMKVDVYYRFSGYVGDKTGADMRAPKIRHKRWAKRNELLYDAPDGSDSGENGV